MDTSLRVTPALLQVLLSLSGDEAHAYGIMKDIEERTAGRVSIGPGSLHYTLSRLQEAGLIKEQEPRAESTDGRRKYFAITPAGRLLLKTELAVWADTIELARARNLLPGGRDA